MNGLTFRIRKESEMVLERKMAFPVAENETAIILRSFQIFCIGISICRTLVSNREVLQVPFYGFFYTCHQIRIGRVFVPWVFVGCTKADDTIRH
jgi:hypothetical protein